MSTNESDLASNSRITLRVEKSDSTQVSLLATNEQDELEPFLPPPTEHVESPYFDPGLTYTQGEERKIIRTIDTKLFSK